MIRFFALALLFLTGCEYTEIERETGYKGKARVNPWLAAERFIERLGYETHPVMSWTEPEAGDAAWIVPASILSNMSFAQTMEQWVHDGGHLILIVERTDASTSDWRGYHSIPSIEQALTDMLRNAGITLEKSGNASADEIEFLGDDYKVDAESNAVVSLDGENDDGGVFASTESGEGRITVITDGRMFRNRWIGEQDHAALLAALLDAGGYEGRVGIVRDSGLSLWSLLREHLSPVLIAGALLLLLWLWRNMSRFGPIESATAPPVSRGYEHHLEALGFFHWKFDHAATLLAQLRAQVAEYGQRACLAAGRGDLQTFLAERACLPPERVDRALSDNAPQDPNAFTLVTADLQKLLETLHQPSMP